MISDRPHIATAIPETLEARLEIVKAIHALAAPDDDDRLLQRRASLKSACDNPKAVARLARLPEEKR